MTFAQPIHRHSATSAEAPRSATVIGAGVVGMATAYCLARDGVAVTIVDEREGSGQGASYANGAQLSYVYTDALASPALLQRMPALALGMDTAFRLRPSFGPDQIRWFLSFLRNTTYLRFRANTIAGLELGLESQSALHDLLARHPLDFHHRRAGKLHIHADDRTLSAAVPLVELKRKHGAEQQILSAAESIRIEPTLASRDKSFAGAIFSPQEEVGDPHLFCRELERVLQGSYAVRFRFGEAVRAVEKDGRGARVALASGERISTDHVVICAGAAAQALLRPAGVHSPIMAMRGNSFNAPPGAMPPEHCITDVARKIVFCRLGDVVRVAGLAELGVDRAVVEPERVRALVESASASLPQAADYGHASAGWAGLRPMSPNSLPDVRRVDRHLSINVGHGMLGWTFAMGTAERLADLVLRRQDP